MTQNAVVRIYNFKFHISFWLLFNRGTTSGGGRARSGIVQPDREAKLGKSGQKGGLQTSAVIDSSYSLDP